MKSKIIWFTGLSVGRNLSNYIHKFKVQNFKVDGDVLEKKKNKKFYKKKLFNNQAIINYLFKNKNKYDYLIVSCISIKKKKLQGKNLAFLF